MWKRKMRKLGWHQWVLLLLFVGALLVTGLFGVRTVRRAIYWRNHRDEQIRPWMSVGYVARSYRVPPHVLYQSINLTPVPHDRRPLREIAREQNRPIEDLISQLQKAITEARSSPPGPPPPPPQHQPPGSGGTPP
jgi:hypothetical protein